MAEIPLRSYLHDIEKHIESGRTDQAIAHCRHILQFYPKYVDAYRLLGKAYLESQRYGDAGDIFQRVLSSVPDDFVSHVGMSIIREDEGNLDEAIWHMERGFEVQPSNNAIQEELRRLYGKRDHVEPPKIRLTRGALARMYYKGELYQQAIGEIRATLADSPDRLDLQALLADIYLKINQRVEAADSALAVLHRLPNCLIANRVMIQVLTGTEREMEQKSYRQRLALLDPYSVFAAIDAPSSDAISEHAIKIEKLDWKPDTSLTGEAGQPAWAASLGVDLGDLSPAKEETLPDWLSGISTEPGAPKEAEAIRSSAFTFDETEPHAGGEASPVPAISEEEIPDWLRQAGWGPSTGAGELAEAQQAEAAPPEAGQPESIPPAETAASVEPGDGHLAEVDIPDWLKAMAPAPASEQKPPEPEEEEDVTPWLEKLIPTSSPVAKAAPVEKEKPVLKRTEVPPEVPPAVIPAAPAASAAELPDWLQGARPVAEEAAPIQAEPAAELPDWLTGVEETPSTPLASGVSEVEPAMPEVGLPDWLITTGIETAPEPLEMWPEKEGLPSEPAPVQENAMELPDWLLKGEAMPKEEQLAEPTWEQAAPAEAEPATGIPDWLLAVQAASPEVESEAPVAEPSTPVEEESGLPDWLLEVAPAEPEPVPAETEPAAVMPTPAAEPSTELPDWLLDVTPSVAETTQAEAGTAVVEPAPAAKPAAELPDWLLDASQAEAGTAPAETGQAAVEPAPAAEPAAELPDWLRDVTPSEAEPAPAEPAPISVEPGAAEPATEMPDWLLEAASLDEKIAPVTSEMEEAAAGITESTSELPAWLFEAEEPAAGIGSQEVQAEQPAAETLAAESSQTIPARELPDWLSEAAAVEEETSPAGAEPAAAELAAGMPAWLLEAEEPGAAQALEPEPVSEEQALTPEATAPVEAGLPDWLMETASAEEETAPQQAEPDTELPAWLFETQEPAPQAAGAEPAGEFAAGLPDWLQESAPAGQETTSAGQEAGPLEAEPAEEIPAWLLETEDAKKILDETPSMVVSETQLSDTQPLRLKQAQPPESAGEPEAVPADKLELDDAFAWLMGLGAASETAQAAIEEPVPEAAAPLPETPFIEAQPESEAPAEPVQEELPVAELPVEQAAPEPIVSQKLMDEDTAFAWLESLATKQGANEALILKPEERLETMPDWVRQDAFAAEQTAPQAPPAGPEISEAGIEETFPEAELGPVPVSEVEQVEQPAPEPAESEPASPEAVIDQDSAFAWLESLAVKQGANEALILKPEERLETMPDWVRHDALTAEQAAPETPPAEPEAPEAGVEETILAVELEPEQAPEVAPVSEAPEAVELPPVVEAPPVAEEQPTVEQPLAMAEPEEQVAPLVAEISAPAETGLAETGRAEPETPPVEAEVTPDATKLANARRVTAGLPELPDWLTESVISPREEMEWTPPPVPHRRYDLNRASLSELERLPGVGFISAQQITAYRDAHGPFGQIDDLSNVPGIHSSMIRGIRDYLYVVEPEEPTPTPPETVIQLGPPTESGIAPELVAARAQLTGGEMPQALEKYAELIRSNSNLENVIQDLQAAAYRFPTDINVWQQLGDACLRVDRVQDALQAFIKAEQLLN
jgi:competence ComEA-like helix-hairpin-helix protein